jgi:two-component system chemotaxis response regulator CheB
MRGHRIIVVGTSAGGVGALQEIIKGLPSDLPASIFVVMHLTPHIPSFLSQVLAKSARLPVLQVRGQMKFHPGHIYVAPPDHHLILNRTTASVNRGPRENWNRPSVDVLFRSAANSHGPRVIGVVLTGFLDDGTAGLAAVKREGGITVVQDPEDAMFPDMPTNAMQSVRVDHVVPLSQIAPTLVNLVRHPVGRRRTGVSEEVAIETAIAKATMTSMNGRAALEKVGKPSTFTCPECQGPLWELRDGELIRFRCQVGHAYSAESMITAQQDAVERALWVALGAIESRVALWRRIATRMKSPHLRELAQFYRTKEAEATKDLEELRAILTRNGDPKEGRRSRARRAGSPPRASGGSAGSEARRRPARRGHRPRMSLQT